MGLDINQGGAARAWSRRYGPPNCGQPAPSVDVFDERQIPAEYMTDPKPPEPKPNKTLIKKAIQDGFDVPGAKIQQGFRLAVR
jgi:hypothetical protein